MQLLRRQLAAFLSLPPAARRPAVALFLWGIGEGLWLYIRPLYVTELGGNPVQVGQVMGMVGLAPALVMLPSGLLSDRFNPRRLMISGWWVGMAGTLVLASAPDWRWLVPGTFLYAVSSFVFPAMNAYVTLDIERQAEAGLIAERGRAIQTTVATLYAAYFAGTLVSPVVGGWLGEAAGLRLVYWVSAVWFIISTVVIHTSPRVPFSRAVPPADDVVHHASALTRPWWRLTGAQARIYGTLLALFFVLSLGFMLAPSFLQDARGLSVGVVGGLGAALAAGSAFWSVLLGRYPSRPALFAAISLVMLALFGLLMAPVGLVGLPLIIGAYFLLGAYSATRTLALGVVSDHTPVHQRGQSFGMVEGLFGVGAFVGPLVAGLLYDRTPALPFVVAVLALLPLMIVMGWALRPPRLKAGLTGGLAGATPESLAPAAPAPPAAPRKRPGIDPTSYT